MVNGNLCHILRVGQPQVDPHGTPPAFAGFQASPVRNAATCRAEMKHDPPSPCVGLGRTRDLDAPAALKFIGPQRAVTATRGAIARRGRLGQPFEAPVNCTAVARTLDHFRPLRTCCAPPDSARQRLQEKDIHAILFQQTPRVLGWEGYKAIDQRYATGGMVDVLAKLRKEHKIAKYDEKILALLLVAVFGEASFQIAANPGNAKLRSV
jgi:hypothetical protein